LKRNIISYNKFINLQPFIIVFVDVSATAVAFVRIWWIYYFRQGGYVIARVCLSVCVLAR